MATKVGFNGRGVGVDGFGLRSTSGVIKNELSSHINKLGNENIIGLIGSYTPGADRKIIGKNRLINQLKEVFYPRFGLVDIRIEYLYQSKLGLESRLERYLPRSRAGLVQGMIFGGSRGLSPQLQHWFEVTGMLHVVSASGYNVGLIAGMSQAIWRRFWWHRVATLFTLLSIIVYVCLAEATPSVVRAGGMLTLQLVSHHMLHRSVHHGWLLLITCLAMILWNSSYLTNLSFQLSVSACLGILIWGWVLSTPNLYLVSSGQQLLSIHDQDAQNTAQNFLKYLLRFLKDAFTVTLAAQSLSWAIQIYSFHEVSLISLVANPAAIWLTPLLTSGGLVFIGSSLLLERVQFSSTFVLPTLAWFLSVLSGVFIWIISIFGQMEWGVLELSTVQPRWFIPAWWLGVGWLALHIKKTRQRSTKVWHVS